MDLLTQMKTFVRVVERNRLSAAARDLGLSLPAVSRQLRALEADLGTALIVRSTRKLHVTDAGREWYEHCVRVLRDMEEARDSLRSSQHPRGRLVVSTSLTFGAVIVLPRLRVLAKKYPELAVELRLEDRLVDLVADGVDVALRAGSPPPDSTAFVGQRMFSMRRVLVASPRWLRAHGTPRTPEQLTRLPCLIQVTSAGERIPWTVRRGDEEQTLRVSGTLKTNAPLALRDLAVDGLGVAFLPDSLIADDLEAGRLRLVLPQWASDSIDAWAIYRAELRSNARIQAFLEVLPRSSPARERRAEGTCKDAPSIAH